MAKDQFKNLHLFVMQSCLPVGMGIFDNAKTGGFQKIVDVFNSEDPISQLQVEGESSAQKIREKIDRLIPGLGNPVVSVDVTVEENVSNQKINDQDALVSTLNRINIRLTKLSEYIDNDLFNMND